MSGLTTFYLALQFTNFARRLAKIINNLIDLSTIPTKYYEFTNIFNKVKVKILVLYYPYNLQIKLENGEKLLVRTIYCQDRWWWTLFLFSLFTLFLFLFFLFFSFLFLEQLGLGFISHTVTSVTIWWQSHKTNHETWENGVEGSGIKWCHTTWTTHVGLMSYTWSFRVGCTVVSMDHE